MLPKSGPTKLFNSVRNYLQKIKGENMWGKEDHSFKAKRRLKF